MRNRTLLPVLLSAVLVACSNAGPGSTDREPVDIDAWTGDLPISAPWLREQLPPGTLTYERIPHPLGLLAIPKGNNFDTALGSEANIQNLINIQQGLAENFAVELPPLGLLDALRSPIEIAAVGAPPLTSVMIAATLSFRSNADFEAFIAELGQLAAPGLGLAAPLDDQGFGQLLLPGLPVQIFVNFDAGTGRLAVFGGLIADRGTFATLLAPANGASEHPMHALEAQIDDSGQGLFVWLDAVQAIQAAGMMAPEVAQALSASPANQVRSLAVGAGVADGKGRLKLLLDVGTDNIDRPLPIVSNEITATSVGDTRNLVLLSIPSAEEFTRLESLALSSFPPQVSDGWAEAKAALSEATGTSIEEILSAIGPEVVTISDRAGDYIGLRIQDHALFDSILERWTERAGISIDERAVEGETIRYLELPSTLVGMPDEALAGEAAAILGIIGRMRTRLYWVADGDYVYLSATPQMLIDRVSIGADSSVAQWLAEDQRMDMSSSLIAATGSMERLPRQMYNAYVGVTQTIADLVGAEYDIWAMPTVNQLGLPDRGTLGFSLNLGEPYVSLELSYDSHPAEILFGGGGMAAVAGVGILAAIAMPAYQDYTIRAQVSEGLNLAGVGRAAVSESFLSSGEAPADRAAAGLTPEATDTQGRYVASVDIANGEIIVRYGNAANQQIANQTLVITPYAGPGGGVVFRCGYAAPPPGTEAIGAATLEGTTLQPQYLPSACR